MDRAKSDYMERTASGDNIKSQIEKTLQAVMDANDVLQVTNYI